MIDGYNLRERTAAAAAAALNAIPQEEIDALTQAILDANRIYVAGWGRAGNVIRLMSMNCSQAGLKTFVVGDNSTPSIHEGDLLIIGSGSGETDT
ncbi:MAG: 6-phospho-3-hexuloisomerase, partial [Clostridia bacterium]|nr:6-phospho-3-hexuloisomerase [Clostridia bacterium]